MTNAPAAAGLPIEAAARAANEDPEFRIAARFWDATLRFVIDDTSYALRIASGEIVETAPCAPDAPCDVSFSATTDVWSELLAPVPRPFYQDLFGAARYHGLRMEGDLGSFFPYYPAMRRFVDLMRAARGTAD
ncbi:MAG: hypothetical protein WEE64_09930 [Dehalococcoidia bacterium]